MYSHVDAVGLAIESARGPTGAVMEDRLRFVPILRAAEEYAHAHGMIVGGRPATLLLLDAPLGPSDYSYVFFSDRAQEDARALTDLIYALEPAGLTHYAVMNARVPFQEFEIAVDERTLIQVKALAVHRGARAADVVVPSQRPARFARTPDGAAALPLLCMGPEIQLIDTYAALADPSRAGDWAELVKAEERLREIFGDEIEAKIKEATSVGGAEPRSRTAAFLADLVKDFVPRTGHALVGSLAARVLKRPGQVPSGGRLQLVTANTFGEEESAVRAVAARHGFNVQSTRNEPKVPTDDRLRRMTMYIVRPGERREPFIDIYNAGDYQLVAYSQVAGLPCGSPFTVLRFILVDAWTLQLLFRMGSVAAAYTRQALREAVAEFRKVAAVYVAARDRGDFAAVFPPEYLGRFQDPVILGKRERHAPPPGKARQQRRPFFQAAYYPARRQ